jgi:hypothetical protein
MKWLHFLEREKSRGKDGNISVTSANPDLTATPFPGPCVASRPPCHATHDKSQSLRRSPNLERTKNTIFKGLDLVFSRKVWQRSSRIKLPSIGIGIAGTKGFTLEAPQCASAYMNRFCQRQAFLHRRFILYVEQRISFSECTQTKYRTFAYGNRLYLVWKTTTRWDDWTIR